MKKIWSLCLLMVVALACGPSAEGLAVQDYLTRIQGLETEIQEFETALQDLNKALDARATSANSYGELSVLSDKLKPLLPELRQKEKALRKELQASKPPKPCALYELLLEDELDTFKRWIDSFAEGQKELSHAGSFNVDHYNQLMKKMFSARHYTALAAKKARDERERLIKFYHLTRIGHSESSASKDST